MPELDKMLDKVDNKQEIVQTPKTMLEKIKALNAQFGGTTY